MPMGPVKSSIAALGSGLLLLVFAIGLAQGEETLSVPTYRKLQRAQEMLDGQQAGTAIEALRGLAAEVAERPYEYAYVMQYLAHAQTLLEQPEAALRTLATALERTDLPPHLALDLRFFQARLLLSEERYEEALAALDAWFAQDPDPLAEAFYYRGMAQYQTGRYAAAQASLEQALALADKPERRWREVLLAAYVQGGALKKADGLLTTLISETPAELLLWRKLASLQLERGDRAAALATLRLAQHLHRLETTDLDAIASMYATLGMPDKGARLLEAWTAAGLLKPTPERRRYLGELWLLARERERAKQAFTRLAADTGAGELDQLAGKLCMEDGQWLDAAASLTRALERGNLDDEPRTRLMLGVALLKSGEVPGARAAFEQAARAPAMKASAEYWMALANAAAGAPGQPH
jgi:tetratricopeptide (TPR) repeat protein